MVGVVVTGRTVGDDVDEDVGDDVGKDGGDDVVVFVKRYGTNPDVEGDGDAVGVSVGNVDVSTEIVGLSIGIVDVSMGIVDEYFALH